MLNGTTSSRTAHRSRRRFLFPSKRHRSFTPSLLLSNCDPLRWARSWCAALRAAFSLVSGPASFLSTQSSLSRAHSAAPRFQTAAAYPQGARRIRKAAEPPTATQSPGCSLGPPLRGGIFCIKKTTRQASGFLYTTKPLQCETARAQFTIAVMFTWHRPDRGMSRSGLGYRLRRVRMSLRLYRR